MDYTYVRAGDVKSGGHIWNALERVYAGGKVIGRTVSSGGFLYLYSGASASDIKAYDTGKIYISSGATLRGASVGVGYIVNNGGKDINVKITAVGSLTLNKGALSTNAAVDWGGTLRVNAGASALKATLRRDDTVLIAASGAYVNGLTVIDGANLNINDGATVLNGVNSARTDGRSKFSVRDGVATNLLLTGSSAYFSAGAGKKANYTLVMGGKLVVAGTATSTVIQNVNYTGTPTMIVKNGGLAVATKIDSGGRLELLAGATTSRTTLLNGVQIIRAGAKDVNGAINSGGSQLVYGAASGTTVNWGQQIVYSKGATVNAKLRDYGRQYISRGGVASGAIVYSNGLQGVSAGGLAVKTTVYAGAHQYVYSGGKSLNGVIRASGVQFVNPRGVDSGTRILKGGLQQIGGLSYAVVVSSGGVQEVTSGGTASGTIIRMGGSQYIWDVGKAVAAKVSSGGSQIIARYSGSVTANTQILSGGVQIVSGGSAVKSVINGGASQIVRGGVAATTRIMKGGAQIISGASANATVISAGGTQSVYSHGRTNKTVTRGVEKIYSGSLAAGTTVMKGGSQIILGGGANGTVVNSGGTLNLSKGFVEDAVIRKGALVTASAGALLKFMKATTVSGSIHVSSGGFLGKAGARITLAAGASITMAGRCATQNVIINVNAGTLRVAGAPNQIYKLETSAKSKTVFAIGNMDPKTTAPALQLYYNTALKGSITVEASRGVKTGVYELAKNANFVAVSVKYGSTGAVTLKVGQTITANGMTLNLSKRFAQTNLTVNLAQGQIYKGTAGNDRLTGTAKSDVFYGGKGNDVITGKGGRDVVVYDKTAWGKDVIAATTGSVTLVFNGLKASDISQTMKGKDMVISRKNDAKQQITVRNWSEDAHNIVYGGTMGQFSRFAAAASPTAALKTAAANEAWKKAGLLA